MVPEKSDIVYFHDYFATVSFFFQSSCIQLLQGFYQATNGTIFIDGIPLNKYDLHWLRQNMAVVSQEIVLFSTTIRQNIMYGNPHATESDMEEVARLTNVDQIVEKFPQVNMITNAFFETMDLFLLTLSSFCLKVNESALKKVSA